MRNDFDDEQHSLKLSEDGSYTAYSKEYDEYYHSTKDGALSESLLKHVIPASKHTQGLEEVTILDICYGLGFNTLATVLYYNQNRPKTKLNIYTPELDDTLVKSLSKFQYPAEFDSLREIIEALSSFGVYRSENLYIELYLGDAREYIKSFKNKFDIVYQDAFSPATNPVLWTKEYFRDIKKGIKDEGILTTYSTALKTRLALYENGFYIYLNRGEDFRSATVATPTASELYEWIDMEHKISCNPDVVALSDKELGVNYL